MKTNIVLLVLGLLPILLVATHIVGLQNQDNVSAALINGFLYGVILTAIINIISLKISKK